MHNDQHASIGVIGGSGLYRLFDDAASERLAVATPYGCADVAVGDFGGRRVAFLARHGAGHTRAPHLIDYRSNIWALGSLGVRALVTSTAVGSLNPGFAPGDLVVPDQYIDRTHGRADTFYDRDSVQHLASADPFCPELRAVALDALDGTGETVHARGTAVVIQGPRFSTRAESQWLRAAGGDIVNMTMYPEVPLAAEIGIGTVNLSLITDSDSGAGEAADSVSANSVSANSVSANSVSANSVSADSVSAELVFSRLAAAMPRLTTAIARIVAGIPEDYAPRELIPRAQMDDVLGRAVL